MEEEWGEEEVLHAFALMFRTVFCICFFYIFYKLLKTTDLIFRHRSRGPIFDKVSHHLFCSSQSRIFFKNMRSSITYHKMLMLRCVLGHLAQTHHHRKSCSRIKTINLTNKTHQPISASQIKLKFCGDFFSHFISLKTTSKQF